MLILQDDRFDATESVTVCLLSDRSPDAPLTRVPVAASKANGLTADSHVMIDKVTTLKRANLRRRIGVLAHEQMLAVERLLIVFLGIAS